MKRLIGLQSFGADLLFERVIGDSHFVVILQWSDTRKLYVFDSAYTMTAEKMRRLVSHKDVRKNNGPLQKSGPSGSAPSVFRDSTESGSYPTGSKPVACEPIGFCRCCKSTIVDLLLLGKSYIDLALAFDSLTKSDHAAVYRFPHEPTPAHTSKPDLAAILVVTPPSWCRGGMNP